MPGNPHTSIRSRQVAAELRALREKAGLSGAEVAKLMGMSPSKISRIETGNSGLQIEDVASLLGLYQVPAAKSRRGDAAEVPAAPDSSHAGTDHAATAAAVVVRVDYCGEIYEGRAHDDDVEGVPRAAGAD